MPAGRRSSGRTVRATTARPFRTTKNELYPYISRKSNFSCHENALRSADYDVGNGRKNELLSILQQTRDNRTKKTTFQGDQHEPPETPKSDDTTLNNDVIENSNALCDENTQQTLQSQRVLQRKARSARTKREYDEEEIYVDYGPLLKYLKHIQNNPDEYISHQHQLATSNLVEVRPNDSIVRMGSIFQRGQHGVSSDSIVVKAAHEIRQRFCDPSQWTSNSKDRNLFNFTQSPRKEKSNAESNNEDPKSEYEIRKRKMEAWLRTVSTAQLNKAKELALHDLGEEDMSHTKWWQYMKSCHYIRQKEPSFL